MTIQTTIKTVKIVRFRFQGQAEYGLLEAESGDIRLLVGDLFGQFEAGSVVASLEDVELLPPIQPGKVVAVGYNYAGHADELKKAQPADPLIFLKAPSSIIGSGAEIVYPYEAQNVSYEGELVVVIGRQCRRVSPEEALNYVLGYTCGNDITDRDLQKKDVQYARAKSYDTFGPLGPYLAIGLDANNLKIESRQNGEVRQNSNTALLLHSPAKLVSWASQSMTLYPGDVIYTGTPKGVGLIQPGDLLEVEVEGIGVLRNRVVREQLD
jgi:2-keto-4-pentenoate hydratase/2-oxohepta-3-ene-1,7-dioic acid hydratase in catechol pathway